MAPNTQVMAVAAPAWSLVSLSHNLAEFGILLPVA
jgi:hypothetical protein